MGEQSTEALIRQVAEEAARRSVQSTLTTLGIDHNNPIEIQQDMASLRELRALLHDEETRKDLAYLRSWRIAMSKVQHRGIFTLVGVAVAGLCAALWAGVKLLVSQ